MQLYFYFPSNLGTMNKPTYRYSSLVPLIFNQLDRLYGKERLAEYYTTVMAVLLSHFHTNAMIQFSSIVVTPTY